MKNQHQEMNGIDYVDGITIVDTVGTILFTVKFNPRFHSQMSEEDEIVGENLLDVFPSLNKESSTLFKVLKTGQTIYQKQQQLIDYQGREIKTTNISLPIKSLDKVIGAIEISRDIKVEEEFKHTIDLNESLFRNDHRLKATFHPERAKYKFEDIITRNPQMKELIRTAEKIAKNDSPVFLYGETGTGKEMFAQAIHNKSERSDKPFIAQNCAALPENLIESILFGTTKGSFTGAESQPGLFEIAENGTLFLDEMNSMPIHLQAKLLRVIQDGYIRRLGDKRTRRINVRIIAAANKHPLDCVRDNQLRLDLYYRLCVMYLHIPALNNRKDDILMLMHYFLSKYKDNMNKKVQHISKEVYHLFSQYHWPGNVRELEHIIEYAMNQIDESEKVLKVQHVKNRFQSFFYPAEEESIQPLKMAVSEVERELITKAIQKTKGNVSKAAKLLEIPRQTLQSKLERYNIHAELLNL